MSDQPNSDKKLSEIGHLFLSNIRAKAGNGAPSPRRIPPKQRREVGPDLTPEEMSKVFEYEETSPAITAVIASHLNGKQLERVCEYARHLTADGSRIGLIVADASEFRVIRLDPESPDVPAEESGQSDVLEALSELDSEVDRWLLLLPNPRIPEARTILRKATRWTLLCNCDHESVVACYRNIKGMSELFDADAPKPALSLALLDAVDEDHARRTSAKLAGVCQEFLHWQLQPEPHVKNIPSASEHVIVSTPAPQWEIVTEFLSRRARPISRLAAHATVETPPKGAISAMSISAQPAACDSDVIALPDDASDAAILSAVLRSRANELIECPIAPPMCPSARLAVSRDRRIVLLAVARQGLAELPAIGQAFRWLTENRALIGMAVPQLSIDTNQLPQLSLLIDQSDSAASTLRPILQSGQVTVQTYRTLRWSGKRGLLLEAA